MYFDEKVAMEYGVNQAIMLANLQFWIKKNKATNQHFYDGHYWTYNSAKAFQLLFPFWSLRQIRIILHALQERGIIIVGNYNDSPYDRTTWYAFADEERWIPLPVLQDKKPKETSVESNPVETDQKNKEISQEAEKILEQENITPAELTKKVQEAKSSLAEKKQKFFPPTVEEVKEYCNERASPVDPQTFVDFYTSKGWYVGNRRMVDWRAAVRTWESKEKNKTLAGSKPVLHKMTPQEERQANIRKTMESLQAVSRERQAERIKQENQH